MASTFQAEAIEYSVNLYGKQRTSLYVCVQGWSLIGQHKSK
jgi:hypothetical protein